MQMDLWGVNEWVAVMSALVGVASLALTFTVVRIQVGRADRASQRADVALSRDAVTNSPAGREAGTQILESVLSRLAAENQRLRQRASNNLAWGLTFSFVGLAVFASQLWPGSPLAPVQSDLANMIAVMVPKFAIGVFLQVTAFFFLRLHVDAEVELRNNRNEITTVQMRTAALVWDQSLSVETRDALLLLLMSTDRSTIAQKGQTISSAESLVSQNEVLELIRSAAGRR